jgi:hypothetical protein
MRTVLGDEHLTHAFPAISFGTEDPLEWEIPNGGSGGAEERNGDPRTDEHDGGGIVEGRAPEPSAIESIEHGSEEPPNSLASAPEQERLWLEQAQRRNLDLDG